MRSTPTTSTTDRHSPLTWQWRWPRPRTPTHLELAIANRTVIGQAEGILMERFGIPADQAFAVLRRVSQHRNVKLNRVAEELVRTRETPE